MRMADWIEFAKYGVQGQMILNTKINRDFLKIKGENVVTSQRTVRFSVNTKYKGARSPAMAFKTSSESLGTVKV